MDYTEFHKMYVMQCTKCANNCIAMTPGINGITPQSPVCFNAWINEDRKITANDDAEFKIIKEYPRYKDEKIIQYNIKLEERKNAENKSYT